MARRQRGRFRLIAGPPLLLFVRKEEELAPEQNTVPAEFTIDDGRNQDRDA